MIPPRSDKRQDRAEHIIGADPEPANARQGKQADRLTPDGTAFGDVGRGLRNLALAIGVILVVILFGDLLGSPQGGTPPGVDTPPSGAAADTADDGSDGDQWDPSALCSDPKVLENVLSARRKWLGVLLTRMANEGSYIIPGTGDPIAESMAHAKLSFAGGFRSLGLDLTEGEIESDAVLVHCAASLEIRDAFQLPDGSWSNAYLILPEARFDVRAGQEGFSVELLLADEEMSTGIIHIAGAQIRLDRLREATSSSDSELGGQVPPG